jgi:creatinine amidohydrolase
VKSTLSLCLALVAARAVAQSQPGPDSFDAPRPIAAVDAVFVEDLTWMEVRDAMRAGKTMVLVASGGVEQNGPYLVTGKHNVVLRATTEAIARKLGNTLVAPILKLVPEGGFEPATGHMQYPGTISLSEETFEAVLRDVARSFKAHGFEHIVFIGDSGGNQAGMKAVAEELDRAWHGKPGVHFIPEYYDYPGLQKFLETKGFHQVDQGIHDDFGITSLMMTVDPDSVRYPQRAEKGLDSINGIPISPVSKAQEAGRAGVEWRADRTVAAIRKVLSAATEPEP